MAYKRISPQPVVEGGTGAQTLTGICIGNGTSAITGNPVTQYDVLVGGASNAVSSVGPGTAGQVLQSGGAAANPVYSTATYPSSTTINQLLYSSSSNVVGGVTAGNYGVLISSSSGVPSWLANGTTGQVLTATTAGTPSWSAAAASGIVTLNGNSGSATGSTVTIDTTNSTIKFVGSGSTVAMNMRGDSSNNLLVGTTGSIGAGTYNTSLGYQAGAGITSANYSIALGYQAMLSGVTADQNIAIGTNSMFLNTVSGAYNIGIGSSALESVSSGTQNVVIAGANGAYQLTSGSYNCLIGYAAGNTFTGGESSNVCLNTPAVNGDSNTLRIGYGTGAGTAQLNKAFISGIRGITSATADQILTVNSSDQIASIAAGTAGQVLVSNGAGSAPSFQASSGVGSLVLIATKTASSSASITFTSNITATYNTYLISWSNVKPSANAALTAQVSTNNGSSYISTNYQSGLFYYTYNSTTVNNSNSTSTIYLTTNILNSSYCCGQLWIANTGNGGTFQCWGNGTGVNSGSSVCDYMNYAATNTATSVNAIELLFNSGNITTGTFNLYGLVGS